MAKFKKIMPYASMTSTGGSLGVSVEVQKDVNGRKVFVNESSVDAYPKNTELEPYTLENQLRSGAQLRETSVETLAGDIDRMDNAIISLVKRVDSFEQKIEDVKPSNEE